MGRFIRMCCQALQVFNAIMNQKTRERERVSESQQCTTSVLRNANDIIKAIDKLSVTYHE